MNTTNQKLIMQLVLETMRNNVIAGVKAAQESGVQCSMPLSIEVDMPITKDGLPCRNDDVEAARLKTTLIL